ncbi:AAA family ATPase, partial [Brachybacterium sp. DNPG3]
TLAQYFAKVRYFHLVPQIIRDPSRIGAVSGDPHGADFIARINGVQKQTRVAWLKRMEKALQSAVPEFQSLDLEVDPSGKPHLIAG